MRNSRSNLYSLLLTYDKLLMTFSADVIRFPGKPSNRNESNDSLQGFYSTILMIRGKFGECLAFRGSSAANLFSDIYLTCRIKQLLTLLIDEERRKESWKVDCW